MDISTMERTRIIPVVVLDDAADAVPLARALVAGGLPLIEVTFRTAAAADSIAAIAAEVPDAVPGAGTVINTAQVEAARRAGAQFLVSPGILPSVVQAAAAAELPIFPGATSATEIMTALDLGLDVVKFFPAEIAGGVKAIKALSGPFPQVRFIPTGGVNEANLTAYLGLSSVVAVGGTWMVGKPLVRAKAWDQITSLAAQAVSEAQSA
ncbi:MAG: bifunctional 4-hydroxy-2-oxoglutarate aldolase/2-dehydro-3-deoxy-phosphogluconate aldolase [Propionibacteriaceae bacterium]|jgi:2-dehydro-3-deoxyphosphogluconate aldolase/(4S)-4-hydroxy-2-oxoglutarate aldolase|nr:bifunctional 4-hydroxy-2-oxoglutarate aldolase/2-dehydro-3-deoxy-phosphogluconate aldolase [Propionibacteriaceae bacterium]